MEAYFATIFEDVRHERSPQQKEETALLTLDSLSQYLVMVQGYKW